MAKCIAELKVCKTASERQDYAFNITPEFSRRWEIDHPYPLGTCIRPSETPTGLEYISSGGQSAAEEPAWPTQISGSVVDGSITWTAQAVSMASLAHRIDDVDWDANAPSGVTLSDQVETDAAGLQEVRIFASGGTPKVVYTCPGIITTLDGLVFEVRLKLQIDP